MTSTQSSPLSHKLARIVLLAVAQVAWTLSAATVGIVQPTLPLQGEVTL